jgi:hypothetical protein
MTVGTPGERRAGRPISRLAERWAACVDLPLDLIDRSRPHLAAD